MLSQSMYPVRVVNVVQLHLFISVVGCPLCFSKENYVQFVFIPMYFIRGFMFFYVICIYFHILVSNTISISDDVIGYKSSTTTTTSEANTYYPSGAPVARRLPPVKQILLILPEHLCYLL